MVENNYCAFQFLKPPLEIWDKFWNVMSGVGYKVKHYTQSNHGVMNLFTLLPKEFIQL